jgi:hypothetical protein
MRFNTRDLLLVLPVFKLVSSIVPHDLQGFGKSVGGMALRLELEDMDEGTGLGSLDLTCGKLEEGW